MCVGYRCRVSDRRTDAAGIGCRADIHVLCRWMRAPKDRLRVVSMVIIEQLIVMCDFVIIFAFDILSMTATVMCVVRVRVRGADGD